MLCSAEPDARAVCPVMLLWRPGAEAEDVSSPNAHLWLWLHPAAWQEAMDVITPWLTPGLGGVLAHARLTPLSPLLTR